MDGDFREARAITRGLDDAIEREYRDRAQTAIHSQSSSTIKYYLLQLFRLFPVLNFGILAFLQHLDVQTTIGTSENVSSNRTAMSSPYQYSSPGDVVRVHSLQNSSRLLSQLSSL
jgi:hypothetical protein